MPVGLPSDLDFQLKKTLPRGVRAYRQNVSPIGGISVGGETSTLKFDVPTGKYGSYIDTSSSYLQIRVQAGATGDIYLDGSAYSLIERLTILSGGAILEDTSSYGLLTNIMLDCQVSPLARQTAGSILLGTGTNSTINVVRGGAVITQGTSAVFCLPLISGFFSNLNKYLPVGAIQNDLRVEMVLQNQSNAVVNTTLNPTGWSITEANLILNYVELEGEVQKMIDVSTGGKYYLSSETFRTFTNTVSGNTSADSILIPARYSSVKGIIGSFRPSAQQNNFLCQSQTHRVNPFTGGTPSIQFSIGSQLYPNAPMRSSAELFAEVQKYFHSLGQTDMRGIISTANWNVNTDPTALAVGNNSTFVTSNANASGTGVFAINLDSVMNRSDVMNAGLSTLNQNIMLNVSYGTQYGSQLRMESFAHLDMILCIEGGVLTVRV